MSMQLNFVCFPNGKAGLNAEHSYADALTVAHMWEWCTTGERKGGYEPGNEHTIGWSDPNIEQVLQHRDASFRRNLSQTDELALVLQIELAHPARLQFNCKSPSPEMMRLSY